MEKKALSEQVAELQQEVVSASMELECTKREALCKQEQDKVEKIQKKLKRPSKKVQLLAWPHANAFILCRTPWLTSRASCATCGLSLRSR